jgi:hypothetical protein
VLQAQSLQPIKQYDLQATQAAIIANQAPKTLLKQSSLIRPEPKPKPSAEAKAPASAAKNPKAGAAKPTPTTILNFFKQNNNSSK